MPPAIGFNERISKAKSKNTRRLAKRKVKKIKKNLKLLFSTTTQKQNKKMNRTEFHDNLLNIFNKKVLDFQLKLYFSHSYFQLSLIHFQLLIFLNLIISCSSQR